MTKSTTVVSKAFVAIVAAAMVFSLVAPAAKAATAEELQAQITALMAQIAALSGTTAPAAGAMMGSCAAIPAPLTMNASGANVTALQNFLIKAGQTIPAGATGFFGGQTKSALAAWQTANGVSPAVGYYGPVTAAAIAAKCVPTTPTTPGTGTGTGTTPTTPGGSTTLKGEADLDKFEVDSASDDTIEEGDEEAEIGEFTVEFADGDAEIDRLVVSLLKGVDNGDSSVSTSSPWDAFDTISLWVDGKMIAETDASNEDDYLDEDDRTLRFSGLDLVAMEDEEFVITVKATIQDNLDSSELTKWELFAVDMRYFDADGVASDVDNTGDLNSDVTAMTNAASFTIDVAGADDEILVKTSTSDPDAATLKVEDDSKSDDYNVFTFDIDTDDSTNDIDVNEVIVMVYTVGSTYDALVDDAEIVIDGTTIDDVVVTNGGTATATLKFNVDGDVTIDAGDRVKAELMLTFKSLAFANEGKTVSAAIAVGAVDGEGADDLLSTGSATGDVHTLRTSGINGTFKTKSSAVTVVDAAGVNDYATYKLSVEVTAFDQDVFISTDPATSTTFVLENGAGVAAVAGNRSVTLTSTGDENGGFFEINEGETETITIEVTYTPGAANTAARLALTSIIFNDAPSMVTPQTWTASPVTTYRTDVVTVVN